MATLLDVGLLDKFSVIFPFLLTVIVVYAVLNAVKIAGDNKMANGIIALVLGLFVIMSDIATKTISLMAPWFAMLFLFSIFLIIAFKIFGATDGDIASVLKTDTTVHMWILALCLIIGFGSFFYVLSERGGVGTNEKNITVTTTDSDVASSDQEVGFWSTIVHPKVLGTIFILLLAMFTMQRLASTTR